MIGGSSSGGEESDSDGGGESTAMVAVRKALAVVRSVEPATEEAVLETTAEPEPQPEPQPEPEPEPEVATEASVPVPEAQAAALEADTEQEVPPELLEATTLGADDDDEATVGGDGQGLVPGQKVEVFSASQNAWVQAVVRTVDADEDEVEVVYDGKVKWVDLGDSSQLRGDSTQQAGGGAVSAEEGRKETAESGRRESVKPVGAKPATVTKVTATATSKKVAPAATSKKIVPVAGAKKVAKTATATRVLATATARKAPSGKRQVVATATRIGTAAPTAVVAKVARRSSTSQPPTRQLLREQGTEAYTQADSLLANTWHKRDQYEYKELIEVLEISNPLLQDQYDEYKATLVGTVGRSKEQIVFHGCAETAIESIIHGGFKKEYRQTSSGVWQRFGAGFYFATNAFKSHEYPLDDMDELPLGEHQRTMILCKLALGRSLETQKDMPHLRGPPDGYDSVYGKGDPDGALNYDELVVYKEAAVLPYAIVRYSGEYICCKNPVNSPLFVYFVTCILGGVGTLHVCEESSECFDRSSSGGASGRTSGGSGSSGDNTSNPCNLMDFVLKTRNCVSKTRNYVSKTRNFALIMMNFAEG